MSTIPPSNGVLGQEGQQNPYGDAFRDVGMDDFLNMLIAELQHQDPLNPMDNAQILQQISHIRDIVASDRLTETLEATFLGQNLTAASNMMGDWVVTTDKDNTVLAAGQVGQVSIEDGVPKLYVGEKVIGLEDVSQIQSEADGIRLAAAMSLLNRKITGTSDAAAGQVSQQITGWVTRVSLSNGVPKLHVKTDLSREDAWEYTIDPANVEDILTDSTNMTDGT